MIRQDWCPKGNFYQKKFFPSRISGRKSYWIVSRRTDTNLEIPGCSMVTP